MSSVAESVCAGMQPSSNLPYHVLIVEDNADHAVLILRAFSELSSRYRVTVANDLKTAHIVLRHDQPRLVITDIMLPDGNGMTLLKSDDTAGMPVIVMTSFGDEKMAVEAIKAGAADYVVKSDGTLKDLPHTVGRVVREWEFMRELFDNSPIAIWEENFSEVKRRIEVARAAGVEDWGAYFEPVERVKEYASVVTVRDINRATLKLLGYSEKAEVIKNLSNTFGDDDVAMLRPEFIALAKGNSIFEGESVHIDARGARVFVYFKLSIMPGYEETWSRVLISTVDMSERMETEQALKQSLAEKEMLLQEVHHRVKNNLQIICSLINLQLCEEEVSSSNRCALVDMETRVRAMSFVHETLYQSDNFASVDLSSYVNDLCAHLLEAYAIDPQKVKLVPSVENIALPLEKAVPCGLLINELVVNALKHAFPASRVGTINVTMSCSGDGMISLMVSDDGIGVSKAKPESGKSRSIGVNLVKSLAEQLGGSYHIESTQGGVLVRVGFPG